MRSAWQVCLAVVAAGLAGAMSGCLGGMAANPDEVTVEREIDLDGRTVVVMPFRYKDGAYFESLDGRELAERVSSFMSGHMPKTKFVSALPLQPEKVHETMTGAVMREMEQKEWLKTASLEDIGKKVGADVVIVGQITELRTAEPKAQMILRGTCNASVTVYDVKAKRTIQTWTVEMHYPQRGEGLSATDTTPAKVKDGVMNLTADSIAKKFYSYKKSTRIPAMEWS